MPWKAKLCAVGYGNFWKDTTEAVKSRMVMQNAQESGRGSGAQFNAMYRTYFALVYSRSFPIEITFAWGECAGAMAMAEWYYAIFPPMQLFRCVHQWESAPHPFEKCGRHKTSFEHSIEEFRNYTQPALNIPSPRSMHNDRKFISFRQIFCHFVSHQITAPLFQIGWTKRRKDLNRFPFLRCVRIRFDCVELFKHAINWT